MKRIVGAILAVVAYLGVTYFVGSIVAGTFNFAEWVQSSRDVYGVLAIYGIIISAILGAILADE